MSDGSKLKETPLLKPPKTYEEQLDILIKRGLIVEDEGFALDVLSKLNYYRFTAYLLPFKVKNGTGGHFPIWVAVEIFSIGMLSRFYANMKLEDKKYISKRIFNTGPFHLQSWLVCLTNLRNLCAHYMRLYIHKFVVFPRLPYGPYKGNSQRIFDIIYVMSIYIQTTKDGIMVLLGL